MTEIVLITGAGIGIGRATAKAFAKAGYHVVATDVLVRQSWRKSRQRVARRSSTCWTCVRPKLLTVSWPR